MGRVLSTTIRLVSRSMSAEDYNDLSERPCGQLQCCVCDGSNGCGRSPSCAHKATIACDVMAAHFTFFWAIVALITNLSTDRDEHGDDKIPVAIHSCTHALVTGLTIGLFWIYLLFVFVSTNTTSPFDM